MRREHARVGARRAFRWTPLAFELLALALLALTRLTHAAVPTPQEYLSGFVLYVRWPDDAEINAWQVCASGADSGGDAHYTGLVVRDRPFAVRHLRPGETLDGCAILDLTGSDPSTALALLKQSQARRSLLTVGNGRDFCSAGGMICLLQEPTRGGFEVNLSAMRGAGFNINAKLLMLAHPSTGAPP